MNRMSAIIAALALLSASSDSEAALSDRARLPPEQQAHAVYLTLSTVAPERRQQLFHVLRFVVPSLSSKPYLGDQLPVVVPNSNLLRLDLQGLGWEKTWQPVIAAHYVPTYRPDLLHTKQIPLVVNGLWFAASVPDSNVTGDSQYQLLYGKALKDAKEFQAFWQVNGRASFAFGRIEGESGVAVQRTRFLENLPTANRGYFWHTFDSRVVAGATDPLENLTVRPPKHDASELIAAIPKHYGGKSGTLQAYFLVNAKGERQEKAPADIVTDSTGVRGVEIRNTISCITCHTEGLRLPTLDQYRAYILAGARIYTYDKATQQEIDRFLDSPIAKELRRGNEDYAAGVELCNGLTAAQNAAAFKAAVQLYDAPLDLEQQAREIYATSANDWRLALGNYSRTYQLSGRLALAAQGQPISRDQWAANYHLAQRAWAAWQAN